MTFDITDLRDCGHVGQTAGVCQYADDGQGCADQVCEACIAACETCRCVLCPRHAVRTDDGQVYCPDHVTGYLVRTLLHTWRDR